MQSSKSDSAPQTSNCVRWHFSLFITQCCFVTRLLILLLHIYEFFSSKMRSIRIACSNNIKEKKPSKWLCYSNAAEMSTITSNKVITILLVHTKHLLVACSHDRSLHKQRKFHSTKQRCRETVNKKNIHITKWFQRIVTGLTNGKCFLWNKMLSLTLISLTLNGFKTSHISLDHVQCLHSFMVWIKCCREKNKQPNK